MSFGRYPAYRDSRVQWLGQLPAHWSVSALKRGFSVTLGKMLQLEQVGTDGLLLPYLRAANIHWNGIDTSDIKKMWFSQHEREQLRLEIGDLLISEGGDVGRSCLWKGELSECYFQNSVNRVRPRDIQSNSYLRYWMSTIKQNGYIDVLCNKSTIAHFTAEKVEEVPVPVPPPIEQRAIAGFLDCETAKIDALVAAQKQLIELLKEKRQALISHVVTKGLHPTVPMKPSGVEWLGDVPKHWDIRAISKLSKKITNGYVGPTRDILVDIGIPYIQATHIKEGRVSFDDTYFVTPEWSNTHAKSILCEEDVLLVQTGAGTGDVGLVSKAEVGFNCHALIIIAPDETLLRGSFLAAVMQSTYGQEKLASIQTGAMHPHLNCGQVKYLEVPVPPLMEQQAISTYIRDSSSRFDGLVQESERAVDLLYERRSALISAAVTGQIDVRGLVEQEAA